MTAPGPELLPLTCLDVLDRLGDLIDGVLTADEVARVRAHLTTCNACSRFGGFASTLVTQVRTILAVPPPPEPDFIERVMAAHASRRSSEGHTSD